ncbi:MAG: phosphotransferase family protein [Deltaproteobacteria bacterium]|nr:MAG: phosphotransferase family protein [Deltaproteobacteria bacterium]
MRAFTGAMAAPLEKALQRGAPQLKLERVVSVERFTSGLSSQSYRVSAETADGPTTWVMRVEPAHGVIPPYDIAREYRLLSAVGAAGLPVPAVLHLEEDATVVGGRFILMSFVEGEIYQLRDPRLAADADLLANIQTQFVELLARIHETPQNVFPHYADGAEAARAQVAVCRRRMQATDLLPAPIFRHALDVLDRLAPPAQRIGLLHGDFRLPNLKWREGTLAGILDWELATVGDPLADVAFTQTIGAGVCSIDGELARRYSERTGIEIDAKRISYYRLLEMVKGSIIGRAGAYDLVHGGDDLRLLSVAAIATSGQPMLVHLEAQLEQLLEA